MPVGGKAALMLTKFKAFFAVGGSAAKSKAAVVQPGASSATVSELKDKTHAGAVRSSAAATPSAVAIASGAVASAVIANQLTTLLAEEGLVAHSERLLTTAPPCPEVQEADTRPPETQLQAMYRDIVAGSCSGIAITLVGHPLDTIKTRLQAQSADKPSYSGTLDCAKRTLRKEGIVGFYRGLASPLSMYIVYSSVYYTAYIQARRFLDIPDRTQPAPMHKMMLASVITGVATTFVRAPMDLAKVQAQVLILDAKRRATVPFRGSIGAGVYIYQTYGLSAFLVGLQPTMCRQVFGAMTWLMPYETLKNRFGDHPASIFLAGGLAASLSWASILPFDAVKTRMQADALCPSKRSYTSSLQCAQSMLAHEGPRAFFRGMAPCLLRAFPANAAGVVAYETARSWLKM